MGSRLSLGGNQLTADNSTLKWVQNHEWVNGFGAQGEWNEAFRLFSADLIHGCDTKTLNCAMHSVSFKHFLLHAHTTRTTFLAFKRTDRLLLNPPLAANTQHTEKCVSFL